jgi:D-3-phosphoglycerate dehydrogenase
MRALVLAPFSDAGLRRLARLGDVVYESWLDTGRLYDPIELGRRLAEERFDILIVESDFVLAETLELAPGLRFVGICRGATNHVDLDAARERGVTVVYTPGRNATAVAELTLALLLALARRTDAASRYVRSGAWDDPTDPYRRFRGREVGGATVGVIGLGRIGRELAPRLVALGARVLAADPALTPQRASRLGAKLVPLAELLRRSDFVCLTAGGGGMILDAAAIRRMRPDAYLIQTGDPSALDYDALTDALANGRLAGGALDVFPGYPLPASHPLLALDNVILMPHIGGATVETVTRHSRMVAGEIERWLRGEPLRYRVV